MVWPRPFGVELEERCKATPNPMRVSWPCGCMWASRLAPLLLHVISHRLLRSLSDYADYDQFRLHNSLKLLDHHGAKTSSRTAFDGPCLMMHSKETVLEITIQSSE